jgi:hypothetical protein
LRVVAAKIQNSTSPEEDSFRIRLPLGRHGRDSFVHNDALDSAIEFEFE